VIDPSAPSAPSAVAPSAARHEQPLLEEAAPPVPPPSPAPFVASSCAASRPPFPASFPGAAPSLPLEASEIVPASFEDGIVPTKVVMVWAGSVAMKPLPAIAIGDPSERFSLAEVDHGTTFVSVGAFLIEKVSAVLEEL
jgi:hypothetical protein